MFWVIALLLAAILITLLGVWKVVPRILTGIVAFILWVALAIVAADHVGKWAAWVVIGLPFGALFIFGMDQWSRSKIDMWGQPHRSE